MLIYNCVQATADPIPCSAAGGFLICAKLTEAILDVRLCQRKLDVQYTITSLEVNGLSLPVISYFMSYLMCVGKFKSTDSTSWSEPGLLAKEADAVTSEAASSPPCHSYFNFSINSG